MPRARLPDLSLTEWAVLAVTAEQPTHGFAIAKDLASDADLGRIWTVPRPLVYRALTTLEGHGLVEPLGAEAGDRGPVRTRVRATRAGRSAVDRWLETPVAHVRQLRTQLLLQLRLLERRARDTGPLAAAQLERLAPLLDGLEAQIGAASGFDRLLLSWRYESAQAAARVLQRLIDERAGRPGCTPCPPSPRST